jgi:hypothetical protein
VLILHTEGGKTALGFKVYSEKTGNSKCASTMKML